MASTSIGGSSLPPPLQMPAVSSLLNEIESTGSYDELRPSAPRSSVPRPAGLGQRRGGFFGNITGTSSAVFKANQTIKDGMRRDPQLLQKAGVHFAPNMSGDQIRDELDKVQDYAKVLAAKEKEVGKIEKQVSDVKQRIQSYIDLLPSSVITDQFAEGILQNLTARPHETPTQHLARIKVVEAPIRRLAQQYNGKEFTATAEQTEIMNIVQQGQVIREEDSY